MVQAIHVHGGDLARARALFGGAPEQWIDLSTGINPVPYSIEGIPTAAWTDLPDQPAFDAVIDAARAFWNVPQSLEVVVAPGASALIAALPRILPGNKVQILTPTYTEHAAAFEQCGWAAVETAADVVVAVHPNNPNGLLRGEADLAAAPLAIVDESFGDVITQTHVGRSTPTITLKSFGKFWGLAGVRLGFAICTPEHALALRQHLGPWSASGPALHVATMALRDTEWAAQTRARLARDADRLDGLMTKAGAKIAGGTTLFRLYDVDDASDWQRHLAEHHIWTRTFGYAPNWLRLGLPGTDAEFDRLKAALQ